MVAVGYGPANLALAIALDELPQPPRAVYLEASTQPRWQSNMLLPGSDIQHNPIRDLVSLRNPRSRYSFINFLFEHDRLIEHLNLPVAFPFRSEYTEYIDWVRNTVPADVRYGARVSAVRRSEELPGGYRVELADGQHLTARAISLGPGRTPLIPDEFAGLDGPRIFHLTRYLAAIEALDLGRDAQVAVIGASQSAVELTLDLTNRLPAGRVHLVARSWSLRAKDHSPFSEEIYFPAFTDRYFTASEGDRGLLDSFTRPTNYSAADLDVLERLYLQMYEDRVLGRRRVELLGESHVVRVEPRDNQVELTLVGPGDGSPRVVLADAVVLATGFRDMGRGSRHEPHHPLLTEVADDFAWTDSGYLQVERDYRLQPRPGLDLGPVYLNGLCESTHGIGDAGSFSLLSVRAQTIASSLLTELRRLENQQPLLPSLIN
ncbi:SidA/IucD/PvdA family monooxygenase [Jatrophihabitans lederbergiae]|uniref:L-lysine N6-monooxygenase MbtG n=1 Tax=Jatrophihabitans lederbergiae TaxID=3075547 RepID=A0ABU2J8Y2_9ACTN|nr:SidA/IucD/PvdA family monooxygenase [Jatrophihabitans sp. DSM 44399]MDT0261438.1 SidA/IucD/PvdA family monooxygenase [Jatrophihabitans sp. DSM 44399]